MRSSRVGEIGTEDSSIWCLADHEPSGRRREPIAILFEQGSEKNFARLRAFDHEAAVASLPSVFDVDTCVRSDSVPNIFGGAVEVADSASRTGDIDKVERGAD